jgi:exo-1,4-beta-D-glucosaminidase
LEDAKGKHVSGNFYWLSTQGDTLDKPREGSDWYYTPTKQFADFKALSTLPPVKLNVRADSSRRRKQGVTHVTIENPSKSLAFFIHLKVKDPTITGNRDNEILPIIWEDNYFSLLPGEKREVSATYAALPHGSEPRVQVSGWNVVP